MFARIWMRFVSADPQFTTGGTLFIVLGFGVVGLAQAAAYLGRRAGLTRPRMTVVRVATFASLLPLGMAAGAPMFPTIVLAPLVLTHHEWSTRTRVSIGVVALLPVMFVATVLIDDLSAIRAAAGFLWFLVVYAGLIWAARFTLAPQLDGWNAPRAARVVGAAGVALVAGAAGWLLLGSGA